MTEPKAKVPAIYTAVGEIRKNLRALQKNGVGPSTQGGYKFLSIDDILEAVRPLENDNGVISWMENSNLEYHHNTAMLKDDGRTARESTQAYGDITFVYASTKDGSELRMIVPGEAIDNSDKATRKAVTQAQKIANITLYNIITGEQDPDSQDGAHDTSTPAVAPKALQKAQAAKPVPAKPRASTTPFRDTIKADWIDTEKVTKDYVNSLSTKIKAEAQAAKKAAPGGDALYQEILKRLEASDKE